MRPRSDLGAVYTPDWLVHRILRRALDPLLRGLRPAALLRIRVLDPACGDGAFLLGAGERLATALVRAEGRRGAAPLRRARQRVAERCLLGVDIDTGAVARARQRLQSWAAGPYPDRAHATLTRQLQRNLLAGDALAAAAGVGAFRWRGDHGPGAVLASGGFHVVVGNPPFLEPKHYRRLLPGLDEALRRANFCTVGPGKVDLALPFLELGVALLRPSGRLGFVIQSRFFRTSYGEAARRWLVTRGLLAELEDYGEAPIFAGHSTYTASLILAAGSSSFKLRCFFDLSAASSGRPQRTARLSLAALGSGPWCFSRSSLGSLTSRLAERHGRLGEHELRIGVGLQLPLRRVYQLEPIAVDDDWVTGRNGLGQIVRLERAALRPLCRNRAFFPLRAANRDAWVLFPYQLDQGKARELLFAEWSERFPAAAAYLRDHRAMLAHATRLIEGEERWHLFRYPKNLVDQARPKVLFPTTVLETAAAVDVTADVYVDNVRVLYLHGPLELQALAVLLSSTVFSHLAREQAALSAGGWRQLNRQYLAAVPIPLQEMRSAASRLTDLGGRIQALQQTVLAAGELGGKAARQHEQLWQQVDKLCTELYGLDLRQRRLLESEPRWISRTELLRRNLQTRAGIGLGVSDGSS